VQRTAVLQQWTGELPGMLWMLEPVLAQAQLQEHLQKQEALSQALTRIAEMRHQMMKSVADSLPADPAPQPYAPVAPAHAPQASSERAAIAELERMRTASHNLGVGMTSMTNATIGLMNAMSGRVRIG
jgi:hypothetical protein